MRGCPWCGGEMEWINQLVDNPFQGSIDFLVCKERCQHRRCQTCGVDIHRGSKDDPQYYDNNDNATCFEAQSVVDGICGPDTRYESAGHQP